MTADKETACPRNDEVPEEGCHAELAEANKATVKAAKQHRSEKVSGNSEVQDEDESNAESSSSSAAKDAKKAKAEAEDLIFSDPSSSSSSSASPAASDSEDSSASSSSSDSEDSSSSSDSDSSSDDEDIVLDKRAYGADVQCSRDGTLSMPAVVFPLWRSWPLYNIREGSEAATPAESNSETEDEKEKVPRPSTWASLEPEPEDQKEAEDIPESMRGQYLEPLDEHKGRDAEKIAQDLAEMKVPSSETILFKSRSTEELEKSMSRDTRLAQSTEKLEFPINRDLKLSQSTEKLEFPINRDPKLGARSSSGDRGPPDMCYADHVVKLEQILTKLDARIQHAREDLLEQKDNTELRHSNGDRATSASDDDLARTNETQAVVVDMVDTLEATALSRATAILNGDVYPQSPQSPSRDYSSQEVGLEQPKPLIPDPSLTPETEIPEGIPEGITGENLVDQIQELEEKAHSALSKLDVYLQRAGEKLPHQQPHEQPHQQPHQQPPQQVASRDDQSNPEDTRGGLRAYELRAPMPEDAMSVALDSSYGSISTTAGLTEERTPASESRRRTLRSDGHPVLHHGQKPEVIKLSGEADGDPTRRSRCFGRFGPARDLAGSLLVPSRQMSCARAGASASQQRIPPACSQSTRVSTSFPIVRDVDRASWASWVAPPGKPLVASKPIASFSYQPAVQTSSTPLPQTSGTSLPVAHVTTGGSATVPQRLMSTTTSSQASSSQPGSTRNSAASMVFKQSVSQPPGPASHTAPIGSASHTAPIGSPVASPTASPVASAKVVSNTKIVPPQAQVTQNSQSVRRTASKSLRARSVSPPSRSKMRFPPSSPQVATRIVLTHLQR